MPTLIEKARETLKALYEQHGCVHVRQSKCVELRLTVRSPEEVQEVQKMLGRIEVRHGECYWKRMTATSQDRVVPVYKKASVERFFREVKPRGFTKILAAIKAGQTPHKTGTR